MTTREPVRIPFGPAERELLEHERALARGIVEHDRKKMDGLIAEEFTFTSTFSVGELIRKPEFINIVAKIGQGALFSFRDVVVRFYGDTAIINCRYNQQVRPEDRDWHGDFLLTDVWVKRQGTWQIVSRHASRPQVFGEFDDPHHSPTLDPIKD